MKFFNPAAMLFLAAGLLCSSSTVSGMFRESLPHAPEEPHRINPETALQAQHDSALLAEHSINPAYITEAKPIREGEQASPSRLGSSASMSERFKNKFRNFFSPESTLTPAEIMPSRDSTPQGLSEEGKARIKQNAEYEEPWYSSPVMPSYSGGGRIEQYAEYEEPWSHVAQDDARRFPFFSSDAKQ